MLSTEKRKMSLHEISVIQHRLWMVFLFSFSPLTLESHHFSIWKEGRAWCGERYEDFWHPVMVSISLVAIIYECLNSYISFRTWPSSGLVWRFIGSRVTLPQSRIVNYGHIVQCEGRKASCEKNQWQIYLLGIEVKPGISVFYIKIN